MTVVLAAEVVSGDTTSDDTWANRDGTTSAMLIAMKIETIRTRMEYSSSSTTPLATARL